MKHRCDGCGRSVNEKQLQPREVVVHYHSHLGEEVAEPEIRLFCVKCQRDADAAPEREGGRITEAEREALLKNRRGD